MPLSTIFHWVFELFRQRDIFFNFQCFYYINVISLNQQHPIMVNRNIEIQ